MTSGPAPIEPFALSIANAVKASGGAISRTRMFDLIKRGDIDARKIGSRTLILTASLRAFIEGAAKVAI